jgi:hypothetical protein
MDSASRDDLGFATRGRGRLIDRSFDRSIARGDERRAPQSHPGRGGGGMHVSGSSAGGAAGGTGTASASAIVATCARGTNDASNACRVVVVEKVAR